MELIFGEGHMKVELDYVVTLQQFLSVNPDRHGNLRRLLRYFEHEYGKGTPRTVGGSQDGGAPARSHSSAHAWK